MKALKNLSPNLRRERVDCLVIGAGVVGIAAARALSLKGREVLVIDAAPTFATGSSSRNSEVIHAGIYYPPHSLKASLCVRGRHLLYDYCSQRHIPHNRIGKLIVATSLSEVDHLDRLMRIGLQNGVVGLQMLDASQAIRLEPNLRCVKALLSPESGILDSHSFILSLLGEAESRGTTFCYNTAVVGGHLEDNQLHLHVAEAQQLENANLVLIPKLVVNSAGLSAPALATRFCGINLDAIPRPYYARGCYLTLTNTRISPFKHLIYPVPEQAGLGVHVTLDLNGNLKFGPNVEWIDAIDDASSFLNKFDYSVNPKHIERFYPEIRKYYPGLNDGCLDVGYAGIRSKISGPGQPPSDFLIQGSETHGISGLVNLFGIESPGLTSSLAIAEYIAARCTE